MKRRYLTVRISLALSLIGLGLTSLNGVAATPSLTIGPAAAAPAWTALFNRTSGWTGADGIYSIPASGVETPGSTGPASKTLFIFNDTFIGSVNSNGSREAGSTLIHNTGGLLIGPNPDASKLRFGWEPGPAPVFVPHTQNSQSGDWYWPQGGVSIDGTIHDFQMRMHTGNGGAFNFVTKGISLVSWPVTDTNPGLDAKQVDTPLLVPANSRHGASVFGGGVMVNTVQAGAPHPDGYVYIYGVQSDIATKRLLVARVPPSGIADFSQWRYWTGSAWSSNIADSAPMTSRISQEFSVTPLSNGQYILVFQLDDLSTGTAYRIGNSPTGPWGAATVVWHCPEAGKYPQTYCYNAKAHPSLSTPGHLLISYNVNTFSLQANFKYAAIYHPRFITLPVSTLP